MTALGAALALLPALGAGIMMGFATAKATEAVAVSYTHLTLPTKLEV